MANGSEEVQVKRGRALDLDQEVQEQEEPIVRRGRKILPDFLDSEGTMRDAAQELPQINKKAEVELSLFPEEGIDANISRGRSAINGFIRTLGELVPNAIKTKAVLETNLLNLVTGKDINPEYVPDYLAGRAIGEKLQEIFPEHPEYREEFWAGTVARGGGQMTGQVITSIATGGLGFGVKGVFAANTLLTSTLGTQYYEEARNAGASEESAFENMLLNMAGNSAVNAIPMALMMRRVDKATGGGLKEIAKSGFKGSVEEGLTEGVQQWYSNMVAKNIYDETRNLMDGVVEGMAAGAVLGATANVSMSALTNERMRARDPERVAEIDRTMRMIEQKVPPEQLGDVKRNDINEFADRLNEERKNEQTSEETIENENLIAEPKSVQRIEDRSKWEKWWNRFISWYPYEEGVGVILQEGQAQIKGEMKQAELNTLRLNKAILNEYNITETKEVTKAFERGLLPENLEQQIDEGLRSREALKNLPEGLQEPVNVMRKHIDYLSREMERRGYVQGKLAEVFQKNIGAYIHRDYKLFRPDFEWTANTIPKDVWNNTMTQFKKRLRKQVSEEPEVLSAFQTMTPEQQNAFLEQQSESRMRDILLAKDKGSVYHIAKIFSSKLTEEGRTLQEQGDTNILKERQDIPKFIREFMGEFVHGSFNYINTIEKLSNTLERRTMFDKMAREYKGSLFLTEEQRRTAGEAEKYRQITTGVKSELDKLYMHQDMYEALTVDTETGKHDWWLQQVYKYNLVAKFGKTALSHVTVVRNVVGGMGFLAFNGHLFNAKSYSPGWQAAKSAFFGLERLDRHQLAEKSVEYERLDLHGKSVRAGELQSTIREAQLERSNPFQAEENFLQSIATRGKESHGVVKKTFLSLFNKASDFYKRGDDFVRIWFYEAEKARNKANGVNKSDAEVAQDVLNLYQNYDRVGELVQGFRRFPFVSPFISFPAELVRTVGNAGVQVRQELQSENAGERKIGRQRLAGMFLTTTGVLGAAAASQLNQRISDDDDEAFREFMPPWDRNSALVYTSSERGKVRYVNTSYTNPYAYLIDPFIAVTKGADDETVLGQFIDGLQVLMEPITSEEIFTQHAREAWTGVRVDGGEVWNPQDTLGDKMQKAFLHLWKGFEPGTITSVGRAVEPFTETGSDRKATDELMGLFGLRLITVDVKDSFGFSIRGLRQDIRDARRVYNSVKFNESASRLQKEEAFNRANDQYEALFERMSGLVDAAQRTGVRWRELETIMKDSGLAQRDIDGLRRGVFKPFER